MSSHGWQIGPTGLDERPTHSPESALAKKKITTTNNSLPDAKKKTRQRRLLLNSDFASCVCILTIYTKIMAGLPSIGGTVNVKV